MESPFAFLHPFLALLAPVALALPVGWWMARVLDPPANREGKGFDALACFLLRAVGRNKPISMNWKRYAISLLTFNLALFIVSFGLLLAQPYLPLNPSGKAGLSGDLIFNTICSFVTNTNLQHYSGEQHLSYGSQLACIVWLQFVTPACGLAAMLAVVRGVRGQEDLGDFHLDVIRSLLYVFIPLSLIAAVCLVAGGVPMTFEGAVAATTLEGRAQQIARGPVAALVAIKQLGTNGGGFFGPNSTHPFENPTPWTNILEVWSILLLPMSSIVMLGHMLRERRHAAVLFVVMLVPLALFTALAVSAETAPNEAARGLPIARGPNMEGKEVRFGPTASATWASITTATSNGSVNAMHDSLNPMGGLAAMSNMMINVAFSGIGAGFMNMFIYIIVAVFLAGLMVGRTPEYLGRKVEAKEVKLAMIALLLHPLLICSGTAVFAATSWGKSTIANQGPHGFSEILYEFTSAAANNGSGFEGLSDNNPPWNIATGIVLLFGRFPALILPIAIAGSLAVKKRTPQTSGTLRTDTGTFGGMLLGTVALVGALSFLPALVLGPVADELTTPGKTTAPAPSASGGEKSQ